MPKTTTSPSNAKPTVTVYSTQTCPWCTRAKQFLAENKVAYVDKDVSVDRQAASEMVKKSGQMGVPVLDIGGRIIVGFDVEAIREALHLHG